jgi:hypothetical protein
MGTQAFIPEIWSGELLTRLQKAHVFASVCNRNYEGDISGLGNVVKINQIGMVNVNTYTYDSTTLTRQGIDDAQKELKINQAKYFDVLVDDVSVAQQKPKLMQGIMGEAAYRLRDEADKYISGLYTDAGVKVNNSGSAYSVTSVNIVELLSLVNQKLSENAVPAEGRWLVAPPWFFAKLTLAKIALDTNNTMTLENGFRGRLLGFNMYESNNVTIGTPASNALCRILAGYNGTITFAEQLVKMEALRSYNTFGEEVRGLYVYGAKVVRPESLCELYASYAAEA